MLRPDPDTCRNDGEGTVNILPAPQLRAIFGALAEISQEVPYSLVSDLQGDILDHVRLNLAQLNDADLTDAAIENVVEPFIDQVRLAYGVGMKWLIRRVVLSAVSGVFAMTLTAGCLFLGQQPIDRALQGSVSSVRKRNERRIIRQKRQQLPEKAQAVPRIHMRLTRTSAEESERTAMSEATVAEMHDPHTTNPCEYTPKERWRAGRKRQKRGEAVTSNRRFGGR